MKRGDGLPSPRFFARSPSANSIKRAMRHRNTEANSPPGTQFDSESQPTAGQISWNRIRVKPIGLCGSLLPGDQFRTLHFPSLPLTNARVSVERLLSAAGEPDEHRFASAET